MLWRKYPPRFLALAGVKNNPESFAERYSHSDMLLIRRIIQKLLSAQVHALEAYTEFSYNLLH